jgi:hypothetical protein
MKLSSLISHPNESFASVVLAFSLFGFLYRNHGSSANGRQDVSLVKQNEVKLNDDNSWYTPPRSPGFHEDFGS